MSNATDQATSTRSDARAFADAFSAADDAFTFGGSAGESRSLTLDELGDVLAHEVSAHRSVASTRHRPSAAPAAGPRPGVRDDDLMTLDELGEALLKPAARDADGLDFDFGTSAHERARRRTAARLDASPSVRRRASGPTTGRGHRADARHADRAPSSRGGAAEAALAAAERLADRTGSTDAAELPALDRPRSVRLAPARELPGALAAPAPDDRGRGGRPSGLDDGRPSASERRPRPMPSVLERLTADPDRIAMWAVLLGILLVLIAVTSGSTGAVALPLISAL